MRLAIFGAGGHGKVVYEAALTAGYTDIVFFDAAWPERLTHMGVPIIGDENDLYSRASSFDFAIVAIGRNSIRKTITDRLRDSDVSLATIIHSKSIISPTARVGLGTVILAGAIINSDALVGDGCILNVASTVDHDCVICDFVHVGPGANIGGEVKIGAESLIGQGAVICSQLSVPTASNVEAGTVLSRHASNDVINAVVPAPMVK